MPSPAPSVVEKLSGHVMLDGESAGECRYEFEYNQYDTNSMRITLFDPPNELVPVPDKQYRDISIRSEFGWGEYQIDLDPQFIGGTPISPKEPTCSARVTKFTEIKRSGREGDVNRIYCSYKFPLVTLTDATNSVATDRRVGYVRGVVDRETGSIRPRDQGFKISSPLFDVHVFDEYDFRSINDEFYPQQHLIRRSTADLTYQLENGERVRDAAVRIRRMMEDIFGGISLVERARFDWHIEDYHSFDSEDNWICLKTTYRWVSPPPENYWKNLHGLKAHRKALRRYLTQLWRATPDIKKAVQETLQNFQIANCSRTIEMKFVYWHACLDFLTSFYLKNIVTKNPGSLRSFSKKLIHVLDESEIDVSDLIDGDLLASIRTGIASNNWCPNLPFTSLRNSYLHEGFHAFENRWQPAFDMTRTMRAIAERMILSLLDMSRDGIKLGTNSRF